MASTSPSVTSDSSKLGRPKKADARVFSAYRLPQATKDTIKRLKPKLGCRSEADVIVRAVEQLDAPVLIVPNGLGEEVNLKVGAHFSAASVKPRGNRQAEIKRLSRLAAGLDSGGPLLKPSGKIL